jgi:hypothetical protein
VPAVSTQTSPGESFDRLLGAVVEMAATMRAAAATLTELFEPLNHHQPTEETPDDDPDDADA